MKPAILYINKCQAIKAQLEQRMGVTDMRILRWMNGYIRKDIFQNDYI